MATTNFDAVAATTFTGNVTGSVTGNVTGNTTGTQIGGQKDAQAIITGDGAITIAPGTVILTKATAAAITIAAPTAVTHDGFIIRIYSDTAAAHVITSGVVGFDLKGSSGTLTCAIAKGSCAVLEARNGQWMVLSVKGVTVA